MKAIERCRRRSDTKSVNFWGHHHERRGSHLIRRKIDFGRDWSEKLIKLSKLIKLKSEARDLMKSDVECCKANWVVKGGRRKVVGKKKSEPGEEWKEKLIKKFPSNCTTVPASHERAAFERRLTSVELLSCALCARWTREKLISYFYWENLRKISQLREHLLTF